MSRFFMFIPIFTPKTRAKLRDVLSETCPQVIRTRKQSCTIGNVAVISRTILPFLQHFTINMNQLRLLRCLAPFAAILLLLSGLSVRAVAQKVVISEYFNSTTPDAEWSELLVVQDNTTMVDYYLRDKGTTESWQGGVKFKDVRLWRNLRAGTIILLYHRTRPSEVYDDNADDGFIKLNIENPTYFEKKTEAALDWNQAMNLNQTNEILQLLDASGAHVHALGHGATLSAEYNALPQPKINHGNSIANPGSLRIYPGLSLADYADPNPGNAKTSDNNAFTTPGRPNKNTAGSDENQLFWRTLRQPEWNAPSLTATSVTATTVSLTWSAATDLLSADGIQGYMVLRTSEALADTNQVPQDGKSYSINDNLGSWIVIANSSRSSERSFEDAVQIPCGGTFKYRVYAFRFKQDDFENTAVSNDPRLGRGRSYNETSFAELRVTRPFPSTTTITAAGAVSFCLGGSVLLTAPALPLGQQIQWQKDNSDIPGATKQNYNATAAGRYRIKITNEFECSNVSNEIEITTYLPPVAVVLPSQPAKICPGDTLTLTATLGNKYQWIKDNVPLAGETGQMYKVTAPGLYRVVVIDDHSCFDTSTAVTITQRIVKFVASKDTLDFGRLDDCTSGKIDSIAITNTGADTIRVESVKAGIGFSYVAPSSPVVIAPGKQAMLTFRFTPGSAGKKISAIDVTVQPCSSWLRFYLTGEKDQARITASLQTVNFGTGLSCVSNLKDTIIIIRNESVLPLKIQGQIVSAPYSIASQSFPVDIPAKDSLRLTLRYDPSLDGTFASTLQLPYLSGTCRDTLRIDLEGVRATPKLVSDIVSIDFPPLLGCENQRDTIILVRNTGVIPVTISTQPADANFRFVNIPLTINPGEDQQLAIRFAPTAEGNVNITLPIVVSPCNRTTFVMQLTGSKQGTTFSFTADTLDFGEIAACSPIKSLTLFAKLRISGATAGTRLLTALTDTPFGAQFNSGIDVKDNDSLQFIFTPSADGEFIGHVVMTFDPCGMKKNLVLKGKRTSVGYVMSGATIDFGAVEIGTVQTRQFTLRNSGTATLTVTSEKIIPPFKVLSSTPSLPAVLQKDSVLTLVVEYAPKVIMRDSIESLVHITVPCDENKTLTLLGNGSSSTLPPDSSALSGVLKIVGGEGNTGDVVSLPIILTSDSIKFSQVTSLSVKLAFNGSMLMPRTIVAGSGLPASFAVSFAESKPGLLKVDITPKDPSQSDILPAGELAVLRCEVLLGNAIATGLLLSDPQTVRSGRKFNVVIAQPDTFQLTGSCPPEERLIGLGARAALTVMASGGEVEIQADIPTNDFTSLTLYDNLGRVAAHLLSGELSVGKHSVVVRRSDLRSGVYFAVLHSGNIVRTICIPIAD